MANASLQFPDDRDEVAAQLRTVRNQAGVVRALLHELERLSLPSTLGRAVTEQVIEELTRLGCRTLEVAAMLAEGENVPIPPRSGQNVKALRPR